jgi:histidinol phosphatase-like enzyme
VVKKQCTTIEILHCAQNAINRLLFCETTPQKQTQERLPNLETANSDVPQKANMDAKDAVTVYDEVRLANVCNLCGSADISAGYGLAGGGGIGAYNFCNGCQRVLDKSTDPT